MFNNFRDQVDAADAALEEHVAKLSDHARADYKRLVEHAHAAAASAHTRLEELIVERTKVSRAILLGSVGAAIAFVLGFAVGNSL